MRDSGTENTEMTNTLEMMKEAITNALELESMTISGTLGAYFRGKAMGVLEVAIGGVLSREEYAKLFEHFESEKERLL